MVGNPPPEHVEQWKNIQSIIERGCAPREELLNKCKEFCQLPQTQSLPILCRVEGGLGEDNNRFAKQVRFHIHDSQHPSEIRLSPSDVEGNRWSFKELSDLINAFKQTFNYYMEEECCIGELVIIPEIMN